jgi:hypothetical protein
MLVIRIKLTADFLVAWRSPGFDQFVGLYKYFCDNNKLPTNNVLCAWIA